MPRCLVPPKNIRGTSIVIDDPTQVHHLKNVLRLKVGDRLTCFDGQGAEYEGVVRAQRRTAIEIEVDRPVRRGAQEPTIWLAQALVKSDRFDWAVQKATEVGATRISPLITRHTIVRPAAEQGASKRARWVRIAKEAAAQCARPTIPEIDAPQPFDEFLAGMQGVSLVLMPTLAVTTIPLQEVLKGHARERDVAILIGPEGDFSREEVALAERYGARPVSLGRLVLRSETAGIAVISMVRYALDIL